ncbi:MAG: hypothetical protein KKE65_06795 [Actinobacteria bacterium]|nr:hypothetical protein [Actinomycetota bacterium]MBU2111349.1 hypothetical protein [Actinomycetota bacterium]
MNAVSRAAWWLGAVSVLGVTAVLAWRGLHVSWVYDEAYNLQVVRNLAAGHGYATDGVLHGADGLEAFDFRISTGPVLLVPAAALVWFLGEDPVVYRLAPVGAWLLLLVLLAVLGRRVAGRWGALVGPASVLVLDVGRATDGVSPLVSPGDVLGEFLATALVVAAVLAVRTPWVGVLLGLAVMTKTVMLLAAPVLAWAVVRKAGRDNLLALRRLLILSVGLLAPVLLWQLVRLLSLGPDLASERNRQFVQFFRGAGSGMIDRPRVGVLDRLTTEAQLWGALGLLSLGIACALVAVGARRWGLSVVRLESTDPVLLLIACGGLMQLWWLFLADMDWVRHVVPGAAMLTAGLLLIGLRVARCRVTEPAPGAGLRVAVATGGGALVVAILLRVIDPAPPQGSTAEQLDVAAFIADRGGDFSFVILDQVPELSVHEDLEVGTLTRDEGQRLVLIDKWWATEARELCGRVELSRPAYVVCRTRKLTPAELDRWRSAGDQ